MRHTNKLIHESSPYLQQHAHNPVDWYPWGEEALQRAKREDKPILVSIGYSACHWCHVMERESFENEQTAAFMNEHFINIKIDREERPDLDHIYMDALQAMTGSGGWPLNVFLTPEARPFYGGTYFPPQKAFNRPSWMDVLSGVVQAFGERRNEIESQAAQLTDHLVQSNAFGIQAPGKAGEFFTREKMDEAVTNLLRNADKTWGGFGRAPKFPQTFSLQFLLRYAFVNKKEGIKKEPGNGHESELASEALRHVLLSLDKMTGGGIYDQAGGGFARYSTDTEWLVPHFEKMLYDNALLVDLLSEAYQFTQATRYAEAIRETIDFIRREFMHPEKGFYAALDADSEGEEGKYYVWSYEEVNRLLGEDAPVFCAYYDITPRGNWEGKNILWVKEGPAGFAAKNQVDLQELERILARGRKVLLEARNKRVRPGLDDKIILGWNALMNSALSKAFAATGHEPYRQLAIDNMRFLLRAFSGNGEGGYFHTWKKGEARYPAFLDDYACLVQALIQLQEITGDTAWLERAGEITGYVIDTFSEEETGFFYYTHQGQADIIVRKKEVYDGAMPSGNAVMAGNLYRLGLLFDRPAWRQRSLEMAGSMGSIIIKYPGSFGVWASLLLEITMGTYEIAVLGETLTPVHMELLSRYIPHRVLMVSTAQNNWPLLSGKPLHTKTKLWLCKNYSCRLPVDSVSELIALINREEAVN